MPRSSGRPFEKFVKGLYETLGPDIELKQRDLIEDIFGTRREFDLTFRTTLHGAPVLGVVECKDHKRKISIAAIEQFSKKCESVNANIRIFVSLAGFTKNAVAVAKKYGIELYTPFDSSYPNFTKQLFWPVFYVEYQRFGGITGGIECHTRSVEPIESRSIAISGINLVEILCRFLVFRKGKKILQGTYSFDLTSRASYSYITCNLGRCRTEWIKLEITLGTTIWRKNIPIDTGAGFFDWKTNSFRARAGSDLTTQAFKPHELHDGEVVESLPPDGGPFRLEIFRLGRIDELEKIERRWKIKLTGEKPTKRDSKNR